MLRSLFFASVLFHPAAGQGRLYSSKPLGVRPGCSGMVKPNFFVVGAAKSGTTAMCDYLRRHPDIFIPEEKEINFFGSDMPVRVPRLTEEQYLNWFFSNVEGETRIGDGSVWYLYTRKAAEEIKAWEPDARILIMLRNPVDAMYSLHSQLLYNGDEVIPDFEEALEAEEDRKAGLRLPGKVSFPQMLFYREITRYVDQVGRFFDTFSEEQVKVILFDDFVARTDEVYRSTLEFLQVDPEFVPGFEVVNPNKGVRNRAFQTFLKRPPAWFRKIGRTVFPRYESRGKLRRRLMAWNTRFQDRARLDPAIRVRLVEECSPDIRRLGDRLGRDLSVWSTP